MASMRLGQRAADLGSGIADFASNRRTHNTAAGVEGSGIAHTWSSVVMRARSTSLWAVWTLASAVRTASAEASTAGRSAALCCIAINWE
jgi:hypothetical protein